MADLASTVGEALKELAERQILSAPVLLAASAEDREGAESRESGLVGFEFISPLN